MDELKKLTNLIGTDYLSGKITKNNFVKMVKASRKVNIELASFLLSQRWYSGLSEYIVSEILNITNLDSKIMLGELTIDECKNLYTVIMDIINKSYKCGGYNFTMPDGSIGNFNCEVYGKEFDSKNNKIIREKYQTKYIYVKTN